MSQQQQRSSGTSGRSGRSGGSGGPGVGVVFGLLVVVWLVERNQTKIMARLDGLVPVGLVEGVREWTPRVLVAVVILAVLLAARFLVNLGRRRRVARIAEGLSSVRELRGRELVVRGRRWRFLTPRRVVVTYPSDLDDRDPEWRAEVESMLAYRMGAEATRATWEPKVQRVTVTAYTPEVVEADPTEVARSAAVERLGQILRPIFGVEIRVQVLGWRSPEGTGSPAGEDVAGAAAEGTTPAVDPEVIQVDYQPMTRDASEAWRRRLEQVVALKVPGQQRWSGVYDPAHDQLVLKPRPPLPRLVPHPGPEAWEKFPGRSLPYALDEKGELVRWRIRSEPGQPAPSTIHSLIVGPTGGGKTTLLRSLVVGAVGQGMVVLGCDIKRIELTPWQGWPGVAAIATTVEDIALLVRAVNDEMNRRYDVMKPRGTSSAEDFREIVLILDEYLITVRRLNRWWAENKARPDVKEFWSTDKGTRHPALGLVEDLLVLARAAGIRVVIGVQRPDAELFEAGARDSLQHRAALTRLSAEGSRMMWGDTWTGTDLPLLPGRAMAAPDGSPRECQTFWVPNPGGDNSPADEQLLTKLRAAAAAHFTAETEAPLELSGLSELAITAPAAAGEPAVEPSTGAAALGVGEEVTERPELPDTQPARAEALVKGDRIVTDEGEVVRVVSVDTAEDPFDEDADLWAVELDNGSLVELPGDSTIDRVIWDDDTTEE